MGEKDVLLLLPGTMCHWKGNFDGVINKLAEEFLAACVAYTGFDEDDKEVYRSVMDEVLSQEGVSGYKKI